LGYISARFWTENPIGFRFSALLARLGGRPHPHSSLLYELGLPLSSLVVLPLCILHAVLRWITRKERIRFAGESRRPSV